MQGYLKNQLIKMKILELREDTQCFNWKLGFDKSWKMDLYHM